MAAGEKIPASEGTTPESNSVMPNDFPAAPASREAQLEASDTGQAAMDPRSYATLIEIYGTHRDKLSQLALRAGHDGADAQNIVSDAFVSTLERVIRGQIQDPDGVLPYLSRAVINGAVSARRNAMAARRYAPLFALRNDGDSTADNALHNIKYEAVRAAIQKLPPGQRQVVILRYYGNMSEAAIAGTLGIRAGTVKSHASRSMATLRKLLEAQGILSANT